MTVSNEVDTDQREFFRINDTVIVEYNPISKDEAERLGLAIKAPSQKTVDQSKAHFQSLQTAFTHLADQINQYDRTIARALRMLDEKINIVLDEVQKQLSDLDMTNAVEANLSAGGIAFMAEQPVDIKQSVDMKLQLLPSATTIRAVANVISCNHIRQASNDKAYYLRLVFAHMSEADRNLLVKHTLSRQAEELRANRNSQ